MMDEPGSFYMCTETSPRCYIIQKVSAKQVDQVMNDLYLAEECWTTEKDRHHTDYRSATPPPPILPWWFTPECERQLETGGDSGIVQSTDEDSSTRLGGVDESEAGDCIALTPSPEFVVTTSDGQPILPIDVQVDGYPADQLEESGSFGNYLSNGVPFVPTPLIGSPRTPEEIKMQLKAQLEYYFSRENLATDRFLRSQMDNDQFVPIRIIAGFPKVMRLTADIDLIVQVLRESPNVQVDESGERVRPSCKRCTIILREIPESTDKKEVESMFEGFQSPSYVSLDYGLNNSWYVTFDSEEATQKAFLHLQTEVKTFKDRPICARIKTGNAPLSGRAGSPQTSDDSSRQNGMQPMIATNSLVYGSGAIDSNQRTSPVDSAIMTPASMADQSTTIMSSSYPSMSPMTVFATIPVQLSSGLSPNCVGFDLGQILASYGYVPRATYRPGATVVHVAPSTMAMNLAAYRQQHQRYHSQSSQQSLRPRSSHDQHPSDRVPSPHNRNGGTNNRGGNRGSYHYGNFEGTRRGARGRGATVSRPANFRSRTPPLDDGRWHKNYLLNRGGRGRMNNTDFRQNSHHYDVTRPQRGMIRPIRSLNMNTRGSSASHSYRPPNQQNSLVESRIRPKDGPQLVSPIIHTDDDEAKGMSDSKLSLAKSDPGSIDEVPDYSFDPNSFPSLPTAPATSDSEDQLSESRMDEKVEAKPNSTSKVSIEPETFTDSANCSSTKDVVCVPLLSFSSVAAGTVSAKKALEEQQRRLSDEEKDERKQTVTSIAIAAYAAPVSSAESSKSDEEKSCSGLKRMSYAQMTQQQTLKKPSSGSSSSFSINAHETVEKLTETAGNEKATVSKSFPRKRWPAPP